MVMIRSFSIHPAAALVFAILSAPAAAQDVASTLPGGASSLQETYQDWSLACRGVPQKICAISQQQVQQSGQRVLAVELSRKGEDALSGNLVLPFGLMLDAGAALQVDDAVQLGTLRFSTCLPAGCLVPLDLDSNAIAALRAGTALQITVQSVEPNEATFSVSLKGLGAAIERLDVLAGS